MTKKKQATYKIGDLVAWTSQSGGFAATKYGTVVGVIEPGVTPASVEGCAFGRGRQHESYVVSVTIARRGGKLRLQRAVNYWPAVSALKRIVKVPSR